MDEGRRPSDEDEVRPSRVEEDSKDEGSQNNTNTSIEDNVPAAQTEAGVVPTSSAHTYTEEPSQVRQSIDGERTRSVAIDKKRKSDEITRETGDAEKHGPNPTLRVDTRNIGRASSHNDTGRAASRAPGTMSLSSSPKHSPSTSKARNRGMSLRSSIFSQNMNQKSPIDDSIVEMQPVGTSNSGTNKAGTAKDSQTTVTVSPVLTRVSSHIPYAPADPKLTRVSSWRGFQGISALPNYQRWAQKQANRHLPMTRIKNVYKRTRKAFLRIQEIPPSKAGRRVSIDPARKEALVDERTGQPFLNNLIKSSKYTPWGFLPRQLVAQFSKLANFYFLFVAILQMIPGLSTTGQYTTIIPLMFFVAISMSKEGYEDLRRHRLDKVENSREAKVLHAYKPVPGGAASEGASEFSKESRQDHGPVHWASIKWQALQVGDVVKLERDEAVPADLVLLKSQGENNLAYIETMALDGETNLKSKQPSPNVIDACRTLEDIASLDGTEVVVEDPNLDLYKFEGRVTVNGGEPAPLTNNEIIYRGSVLRNTPEAIGMVIYSGEECKIRMNANKNPRIKAPALQAIVNKIVVMMVIFVVALALFNTIGYQVWQDFESKAWYLTDARVPFGHVLTSFIIMFNTLIPLSLYVSLEIIKLGQMVLMKDVDMYDEVSNTPFEARTSTINEELGQVSYIFSDKTGTLTENVMRFRKLSVAGTAWLHDVDLKREAEDAEMAMRKKRKLVGKGKGKCALHGAGRMSTSQTPRLSSAANSHRAEAEDSHPRQSMASWRSAAAPDLGQPELSTIDMIRYIQRRRNTAFSKKATVMLLSLALCHTCLPERSRENEEEISYQAASPDELALVQAARELGFVAYDRQLSTVTLRMYPNGLNADPVFEKYEILDVIEFTSKRKRMSVLVRFPDGRTSVICKGADSVIIERLRLSALAIQKLAEVENRVNERRSMEAQQALHRKSSAVERQGYPRASISMPRPSKSSIGRLGPIRDDIDGWLADREFDVAMPVDTSHYTPRPSAQIARKSLAASERSLLPEVDDEPLVEEALVSNDAAVIERCFQHINDFATEGLRTLMYGYRFLDDDEYRQWKKVYQDATTSLVDREKRIEEAGELIEQQLELGGATAIEDKLQKGVPETIDRLRRASIKILMLTGDKRETAINIGHSCRLIKDYSSVTVLDYEAGGVEQSIAAAIVDIDRGSVAHSVVVIDGRTLGTIQAEESFHTLFQDLAILADSVICCRASPSQKAALVHAIRRRVSGSVTLAIGDGANDIAMIQEAHVGIGITGKEGSQAARVSDYSIAQFRFLNKLLLVHGRWNYIRTSKYVLATFWKELLFYLTQALYQRWNGYTGTSLYEQWSLSQFNTLFTSLPVIFLGIFEKDLAPSTLIAVPELYTKGQRSAAFNFKVYLSWMFMAASEAMIVFFVARSLFGLSIFTTGQDLFPLGDMTFSACIILINTKLQLLEQRNRTIMALICMILEVGGWFLWNIIFSIVYGDNSEYNVKGGFLDRFGNNPLWWLCLVLIVASCILFEIGVRVVKNALFPSDVETFQQLEGDVNVRRRFEESSASILQASRPTPDPQEAAKDRAKREGEVQDLLSRPRMMEEGKSGIIRSEEKVASEEVPIRRSTEMHEMLSRRFGRVVPGSLAQR